MSEARNDVGWRIMKHSMLGCAQDICGVPLIFRRVHSEEENPALRREEKLLYLTHSFKKM
jgi:hypothetical protein